MQLTVRVVGLELKKMEDATLCLAIDADFTGAGYAE